MTKEQTAPSDERLRTVASCAAVGQPGVEPHEVEVIARELLSRRAAEQPVAVPSIPPAEQHDGSHTPSHALRPCPFCGYALPLDEGLCVHKLDEFGDEMDEPLWRYTGVCCANCSAYVPGDGNSRDSCIAAWNRRAAEQQEPGLESIAAKLDAAASEYEQRGYAPVAASVMRASAEAIRAMLAASPPPVPAWVRVKPLLWSDNEAETILGTYRIHDVTGFLGDARFDLWIGDDGGDTEMVRGGFGTWNEAAAAAQDHIEQRINSALEPVPAGVSEERVEAIWRELSKFVYPIGRVAGWRHAYDDTCSAKDVIRAALLNGGSNGG